MPAFGTVTLVARTSPRAPADGGTVPPAEPVEPIYARYWLHGKGPAPAGNVPVAAHFSPTRVALADAGDTATLTLTVGCGVEPAAGTVELVTPAELTVSTEQDLRYELAPGGYAAWELAVRAAPGTGAGRYFVAARIRDGLGHLLEDTAMVAVGERRWPDPALPPEEALEVMQADYAAAAAEVDVAVLTPELNVAPGGRGEIVVNITSRLASELHGEAQVISPFGTWDALGPATQGFSVHAAGDHGGALRRPAARDRPAGGPLVGVGQSDVLRASPVHTGHPGFRPRRIVTPKLRANRVGLLSALLSISTVRTQRSHAVGHRPAQR